MAGPMVETVGKHGDKALQPQIGWYLGVVHASRVF
jgi:hypothetical protein